MPLHRLSTLSIVATLSIFAASPAHALTMKECSSKFQAAKEDGTLDGMKWNDFRKSQCSAETAAAAEEPATPTDNESDESAAAVDRLSMKECSAKYKAAKDSGALNGQKWNEFRKAECQSGSASDGADTATESASAASLLKSPSGVSFPSRVSTKFADETPARQRMKTCLESYNENKEADTLNGMRWIQKGGGYYSLCSARLKGAI